MQDGGGIVITEAQLRHHLGNKFNMEVLQIVEWSSTRLDWKASNTVTDGLYRVEGKAIKAMQAEDWSLIIKVIVPAPETDDPNHYCYWKREPLFYRSGLGESLPFPVRAPKCYGVEQRDDGTWRIWLEEFTVRFGEPWDLHQYGDIAEKLGQFNGAYLTGRSLPSEPWLCRGFLSSWTRECDKYDSGLAEAEHAWNHPRVKEVMPAGTFERYRSFRRNRALMLRGLYTLPKVFTHNDAWQPNLFPAADGGLMMIDWSNCGLAGVGEELGRFYGLSLNAKLGALPDKKAFSDEIAARYFKGLQKAGWHGDDRLAEFGFVASAGIRCGMMIPKLLEQLASLSEDEATPEEWKERGMIALHLLDLAEASRMLANELDLQ